MPLTAADFQTLAAPAPEAEVPGWRLPVKHFSASSIEAALCPEKWRQTYLLRAPRTAGAALVVGSAVHEALAENFRRKMQTGVDLDAGVLAEVYDGVWPKVVENQGKTADIDWGQNKPEDVKAKGFQLTADYVQQVAPRLQPVAVEEHFFGRIVPGLPVPIKGYIDLVVAGGRTIDYKTSSRAVRAFKAGWKVQGRIYQMVKPWAFEWHVLVKTAQPQIFTPLEAPDLAMPYSAEGIRNTQVMVRDAAWLLNYLYCTLGWEQPWPTFGLYADRTCAMCSVRAVCPAWRS